MARIDQLIKRVQKAFGARKKELATTGEKDDPRADTIRDLRELQRELWEIGCEGLIKADAGFVIEKPPAGVQVVRFGWPHRSSAHVVEEHDRSGLTATVGYDLDLMPAPRRLGMLRLVLSNFEYRIVAGRDATAPEKRLRLGKARTMAASLPVLLIDYSGRCAGLEDECALYSQVEKQLGTRMTRAERKATRHLHAKAWLAWAWSWLGCPLTDHAAGGKLRVRHLLAGSKGVVSRANWTCEPVAGLPGTRLITMEARLAGRVAREALRQAVCRLNSGVPVEECLPPSFRFDIYMQTLCDVDTGRPYYAARVAGARLLGRAKSISAHEAQQWTFDWTD
jgi:hypothetical protein